MDLTQFEGHTPGPWAPVEIMGFAAGFAVEDDRCATIARVMKTFGADPMPSRINAHLIAAAPCLLAEVRRLTAEAAELRRERDELASGMQALRARLAEIEAQPPVAWVRYRGDGGIQGPLLDEQVEPVRRASWTPLIAAEWANRDARPAPGRGT